MAQTIDVNFRLDERDKKNMESVCSELGITMSAAFIMFAKKVGREKRIPFEVSVDPFYSDENMTRLRRSINDVETGRSTLREHELIEE